VASTARSESTRRLASFTDIIQILLVGPRVGDRYG